jgi:glycosyltransferase involved in cell wall biosynthesis
LKKDNPLISVILPVYNAALYIEESIKSILNQTYSNFELIVIDDGATDNSAELIKKFKDDRIRFYSQSNMGMAKTLNKAIDMANGKFIARQDADDISLPQRFEKQVQFLLASPEVNLLGTSAEIIPVQNNIRRFHKHPVDDAQLKIDLFFDNPFVHSSVMMRVEALKVVGYYDIEKDSLIQDYDLWSRFSRIGKIANLSEPLVEYREVNSSISRTTEKYLSKVISQSIENINYIHPENMYFVRQLTNLYHKEYGVIDAKISFRKMIIILNDIVTKISIDTGENIQSIKLYMNPHVRKLISRYYDFKKQEAGKNILLKFWFRVLCRIRLVTQF